jgi:hypothetical protein
MVERQNRTLMDMVHSMLSHASFLVSLWMEALKMTTHVLNLVPSKPAPNTPYEMWMGKKPILNYLCVWGYPAEAKVFNPQLRSLIKKKVSISLLDTLLGEREFTSIVWATPQRLWNPTIDIF